MLVTSREPLRIAGERELPVPPLSLPNARQAHGLSPAALLEYSAIRLFVERAQAVKPDFALSEANAPDVATICQRLDGLPLAIELAAARVRVLPPGQLLARLDKRLKVLTGGNRDLPARQQTLRAAIEWSHDLLRADEQALFARLAVFSGGCTFEAAEAVCDASGDLALDVLDGLDSLTQKSLLRPEEGADGEPRFTMLETIREFGLERLDATGDAETMRRTHVDYFLLLAEEAEPQLRSPDQIIWLNRLGTEHDNFRSALGWLEHGGGLETRLRLVAALWRFWWMRGHLTEGRGWLDRALDEADGLPPAVLAKALSGAGILAESQGDYEPAILLHEKALGLWSSIEDQFGIASAFTNLGIVADVFGDYDRATDLHTRALAIWRELDDDLGIAGSLNELGKLAINRGDYEAAEDLLSQSLAICRASGDASAVGSVLERLGGLAFYREDYDQAARFHEESLDVWRELHDSRMIAQTLVNLGEVVHHQGGLDRAEESYQEALLLFRELGDKGGIAFALTQLGKLVLSRNDVQRAMTLLAESLELRVQAGDKSAIVETLEGLAAVACARGDPAGVRIFAATEALRLALGAPLPASYGVERESTLAGARVTLGDTTYGQEWNRGRALSLDQAISEVKALIYASPSEGPTVGRH